MIRHSLNLHGDENTEDAVEELFGVRFTGDELAKMETVGDLHDALVAHIPARAGKCETSMVFYRLRHAMKLLGLQDPVRPGAMVPAAISEQPKAGLKALSRLSGLKLPFAEAGPLGHAAWLSGCAATLLIASAVGLKLPILGLAAVAAISLTVVCGSSDRGRMPAGVGTVGDLARRTMPLNYGALVADGARSNARLIWAVLIELLGDVAEVPPDEIGRDTRFYVERKAVA